MTDIEWGPAIAVDGKRPGWLDENSKVDLKSIDGTRWYSEGASGLGVGTEHIGWQHVKHIRLPADHPHYRQPAPIDWSGELEAVHEDGRTVAMRVVQLNAGAYGRNDHWLATANGARFPGGPGSHSFEWAHKDGDLPNAPGWRIRNVPQPTPQADTKPDVTARMENLVHLVADGALRDDMIREEAQAIKALLRGPEDPDLIEAREIMQAKFYCNDPEWQGDLNTTRAYKLIKRGRELALAGETEA